MNTLNDYMAMSYRMKIVEVRQHSDPVLTAQAPPSSYIPDPKAPCHG